MRVPQSWEHDSVQTAGTALHGHVVTSQNYKYHILQATRHTFSWNIMYKILLILESEGASSTSTYYISPNLPSKVVVDRMVVKHHRSSKDKCKTGNWQMQNCKRSIVSDMVER